MASTEDDLFHEDHAISFAVWLAANHPDALYKYGQDEDGGEEAFESLYKEFQNTLN